MKKRYVALAVGLGATLALLERVRQVRRAYQAWELLGKRLRLESALMVETAHLLTDGKVPDDVQRAIYGEVIY
jgi:hypothetical protein